MGGWNLSSTLCLMNGQAILNKFYLQVDDSSELSDAEALDLANDVYGDVCDDRAWSWLRATYSGTTSASVPYIALPSDFNIILPNYSQGYSIGGGSAGVPIGAYPMVGVYSSPWSNATVFV